jgi:hypothetical protein
MATAHETKIANNQRNGILMSGYKITIHNFTIDNNILPLVRPSHHVSINGKS